MAYKKTEKHEQRVFKQTVEYDEVLDRMLRDSVSIYDQTLYYYRLEYFRCRDLDWAELPKYPSRFNVTDMVKVKDAFITSKMDINIKQECIAQASEAWTGYIRARKKYKEHLEEFTDEPQMPRYKYRKQVYNVVTVNKTRFRGSSDKYIKLPCTDYNVRIPDGLKKEWIDQLKISYRYGKFHIVFIYNYELKREFERQQKKEKAVKLNPKAFLGIDLGQKLFVAGTTYGCDNEQSFIIRGSEIKQLIKDTNDSIARLTSAALISKNPEITKISKKDGQLKLSKNSRQMSGIWEHYNNSLDNFTHCTSNMIIDFCTENCIGNIVIGHNEFWKQNSNIGRKNNGIFCKLPHTELIEELKYKCKSAGIRLIEVEESYTSKCDHLANEDMCHHDTYLGKRRGRLYYSSTGKRLHSDINGCIGMLRKANVIQDAFGLLDRGDIVSSVVLNVRGYQPRKQRSPKKTDVIDNTL